MLQTLGKAEFYRILFRIDEDLARLARENTCRYCGGPLHVANYDRKPRGGPGDVPEWQVLRQGLCCGREGCRKRTLPPSVRFMGRRVYWGALVVVLTALRQQRHCGATVAKLKALFDISHKTLLRWLRYFREAFPQTPLWQSLRGRVSAEVSNGALPQALLEHFGSTHKDPQEALVACLRFLAVG